MRVYVPDKKDSVINEVLKELYLLRESIVHKAGNVQSRIQSIDKIRVALQDLLAEE